MSESFENTDKSTGTQSGLTRRQVAIGAAWAAPVVALAVATPLAAASPAPPTPPSLDIADNSSVNILATSVTFVSGPTVVTLSNPAATTTTGAITFKLTGSAGFAFVGTYAIGDVLPTGWVVTAKTSRSITIQFATGLSNSLRTVTVPSITMVKNSAETWEDQVLGTVSGATVPFNSSKVMGWQSNLPEE